MNTPMTLDTNKGALSEDLGVVLARIEARLERVERGLDAFEERAESLAELKEDLMPMANGLFQRASDTLGRWEETGALAFLAEASTLLERVATSFTPEDVRLLGENLVGILETVRNLTQPEIREIADRATGALRAAEHAPEVKPKLLRSLRDPEVRRGMGLMLTLLKELGAGRETVAAGAAD